MRMTGGDDSRARAALRGLDLDAHLRDPALKQRFVTPLFDLIAPRYDRFTRLFSFGMDRRWKETLLSDVEGKLDAGARALDLACGTGDLALDLARRTPVGDVVGIDASARMIAAAERRLAATRDGSARVRFHVGDMMRLDVPDRSVDLVTIGYGLRNAPDAGAALREIRRVLRPGGRLATLDFYLPANALWRRLYLAYLFTAGNAVGWLWHREPVVYGYIARSLAGWMTSGEMSEMLREVGFQVEKVREWLRGGIAVHIVISSNYQ
jgi:demethylmenaquinone methyltransferase/2-methoxy-6-polyprenyl-1,4-benzoquinol methylase